MYNRVYTFIFLEDVNISLILLDFPKDIGGWSINSPEEIWVFFLFNEYINIKTLKSFLSDTK